MFLRIYAYIAFPPITLANATLNSSLTVSIPSPTRALRNPTAVDMHASQGIGTGLLFRSSCGINPYTVAQCPYLCSQGGGGANLLFPGNSFPYGFVIDQVDATYDPIEINAGNGTKGIFIHHGIIKYRHLLSEGFNGAPFIIYVKDRSSQFSL